MDLPHYLDWHGVCQLAEELENGRIDDMSGHSKWSTIKHKKAANDKVKGSVFTKMAKAITVAVKKGGGIGDPNMNFTLRLAIEKARNVNMPRENIERAIEKGTGKAEGSELAEVIIEGFAPGGVAVIIEAVTDNSNRTIAELRNLMEKHGGRMGEPGSVMYMFERTSGEYKPKYPASGDGQEEKLGEFMEVIGEHDDVQEIYANLA
jgi:YebC/PmpR family DNA-binding regulatory protein